ncbi:MAG: hypothetical protein ACXV2B_03405 [Halobacteriota archaeon]
MKVDNRFAAALTIAQVPAGAYVAGLAISRRLHPLFINVAPGLTRRLQRLGLPDINKTVVINALAQRRTSLGNAYLEFPLGMRLLLPMGPYQQRIPPDNPYEIAPGKRLIISHDNKKIAEVLQNEGYSGKIPFRASIDGAGWRRYKSKKKLIDANTGIVINWSSSRARLKWLYWTLTKERSERTTEMVYSPQKLPSRLIINLGVLLVLVIIFIATSLLMFYSSNSIQELSPFWGGVSGLVLLASVIVGLIAIYSLPI